MHYQRWKKFGDASRGHLTHTERFWHNTHKTNECWIWTGALFGDSGYGRIMFGKKNVRAHRFSYFLHHGRWPAACVLHSCDNRVCVNPDHLREGTRIDNMADMVLRNRQAKGKRVAGCRLTETDVLEIRLLLKQGKLLRTIAAKFGVSLGHISQIKLGNRWTYL